VTGSSKRKGDRAELEVQGLLRDLLGVPARRALGAGRKDDVGDIHGVPDTVIQVADWKDALRAVREKPLECEEQRLRGESLRHAHGRTPENHTLVTGRAGENHEVFSLGATFAATFVRLRGGEYRVVLTPEQWATLWREAQ
jgi:hypothetical protein